MTTYTKPSDVLETVGVSGVLSAGLTWHAVGEDLAWAEFDKPADAVKYTATKRGKGRKFAVMVFEPGKQFSGVIYLTSVKRGLDAGRVITEGQLLDLYHGKKATKTTTQKPAAGLQFGPALVADKNGKATIASLLHAGKVFASRTIPAEFSARFKKYSEDNRLLLYVQGGPNLGPVATYRGWLKQGRQVSKGQHGLKILAPRMVPDKEGNPKIDGLRLVTLFDISQTEELKEKKEA